MEYAYKVVKRVTDTLFVSVIAAGQSRLIYELGHEVEIPEWLSSNDLYPLLFSSRLYARLFRSSIMPQLQEIVILKCECQETVDIKFYANLRQLENGKIVEDSNIFPAGTVSYKKVVPIEIII